MLDDFVQHPNDAAPLKSQTVTDDNGWQIDPAVQLLEIEQPTAPDSDDGMFELTQVQFTPPSPIVHLCVISNHLFILLESAQILRINLVQADIIDTIDVHMQSLAESARIYTDASLKHTLVQAHHAAFYIHGDSKRSKQLPKLSKLDVSCLHFVSTRTALTSAVILAGTRDGGIYQAVVNPNPSDLFRKNTEERQLKHLFSFNEPVVDVNAVVADDRKSALVIVITQSRLYTFIGAFSKIDNDGGSGFETVFAQPPFSIKITESRDTPHASLASFFYDKQPHKQSAVPKPASVAWLCDRSLYSATLDTHTRNPEMVCTRATLAEVDIDVKDVLLTAHHCLCLYDGGIKALRVLDGAVVWDQQLPSSVTGMHRDNTHGTLWLYSNDAIYELTITDEDRDIWKVHLTKRDFESALRCSKGAHERDVILGKQADLYFAQKKYIQSAQIYAQAPSKAFESVVLKFVEADERDALRYYLSARLERSKKTELTQRMMLATWLLEIYLDKLNHLEDLMSQNTNEDAENARMELDMMLDDVKVFLKTYKQNLDKNVVYKSLKLHARKSLLVEFAGYIQDYNVMAEHYALASRWRDVLHVLAGQSDLELYYRYAPRLVREAAQNTVEIWKREPRLELKRLIPALIQCENLSRESRVHTTNYLDWKLEYDGNQEPIAHNVYITLLSKDEDREAELVEYLKRTPTPKFDMDFALRLFHKRGLKKATIQVYALMELYDCSVDLAIECGDLDLARVYADKPVNDPILRKKLWLRIAKVIVQDRKDIKSAMQFLEGSDVLQLEDILPFFPSFEVVDEFKEEICGALDRYSSRIHDLQSDMDKSAATSQRIEQDTHKLKERYVVVGADEKCAISGKPIAGSEFYVFPTQRVYRVDALIERLATYAEPSTLRRIVELQAEIEGVKKMQTPKPTPSWYFNGEKLRELVTPATINQIFNTSNKTAQRKDVVKLRKELDEILSKSDPLVEESVVNIDKPFDSKTEWTI